MSLLKAEFLECYNRGFCSGDFRKQVSLAPHGKEWVANIQREK